MRGLGREISSGLRAFCKEISWKIGGKKISGYQGVSRISRRTFDYIVRVVGLDLTKRDTRLRQCIHVNKRVGVLETRIDQLSCNLALEGVQLC